MSSVPPSYVTFPPHTIFSPILIIHHLCTLWLSQWYYLHQVIVYLIIYMPFSLLGIQFHYLDIYLTFFFISFSQVSLYLPISFLSLSFYSISPSLSYTFLLLSFSLYIYISFPFLLFIYLFSLLLSLSLYPLLSLSLSHYLALLFSLNIFALSISGSLWGIGFHYLLIINLYQVVVTLILKEILHLRNIKGYKDIPLC
jgi:hypothetical protein